MKKRIALAAIAALAGGLLVAAPASAASVGNAPFTVTTAVSSSTGMTAAETATATAGALNFVEIGTTGAGDTVTAGGTLTITGGTFASTTDGTLSAGNTVITFTDPAIGTSAVRIPTPTAGTIVVKYNSFAAPLGIGAFTTQQTFTITVSGVAPAAVYNHSVVSAIGGLASGAYADAAGAVFADKGALNTPASVGTFTVSQYASADASVLATGLTKAVTVSLSGVGVLADSVAASKATYLAYSAGGATVDTITVFSDGRAGVATVTVAIDGVVAKTFTVSFYGAIASFALSISNAQLQAAGTFTLTLTKKDANGIAVPTLANWSADTATVGTRYQYVPGTETATITYGSKLASVVTAGNGLVDTKTVVANWVTAGASTVTLTADKTSYAPGEKMTFAVTAKNSDGVTSGDANYPLAVSGSASLYGAPTSIDIKNGAGSFTAYAPVLAGPVVVVATVNSQGAATLTTSVVDAAAVAQAAAITALQTSVAALTTTVASLVASMTAQIKVINATMLKIQKALAALRASLKK